ncbi:MAG: DUF2793 domain-containing protein [Hyphomicrobiales bacterium]
MPETPLLALPLLEAAQAQKHITHNEALLLLDAAIHLAVITRSLAAPPPTPADGDRYLVAAAATGAWVGRSGQLAFREAGAWRFAVPRNGWRLWAIDEQKFLLFDGAAWRNVADFDVIQNVSLLGVKTTADAGNRLSVSSPATLLSHEGAGHQLKINKQAAANTASLLFQTNFSGRAEMGLTGDDNFHFKVSPDGTAWNEAIQIDKASGVVTLTGNSVSNAALADMATARIKGRTTAGTGDPEDLTAAQATALLDTFTATAKGLVPASGGGMVNFLRADGAFATPAGGGSSSVASLAALRLLTTASYSGVTVYLESWHAGLNRGGGYFRYDSADTTSSDDNGLTIVDASLRRWKRQMDGGLVSPAYFGAKGDGAADDAVALQKAIDVVTASLVAGAGLGRYTRYLDLEGLAYVSSASLNCTGIKDGFGWAIRNGTIIGKANGKAVFDCVGSQYLLFDNVFVNGALVVDYNPGPAQMPAFGWQFAPSGATNFPVGNTLRSCKTAGFFSKASVVAYGAEILRIDRPNFQNHAMQQTAATFVCSGHRQTVIDTVGDLVSDFSTIKTGITSNSMISVDAGDLNRYPPVALAMTAVTQAADALVTVGVAALTTAIDTYNFANGTTVFFTLVTGMTQINGLVGTVANLNAAAGTFNIGIDTTTFGAFIGGTCYNQTGPNIILGTMGGISFKKCYASTKGRPGLKLYTNQAADANYDIDLDIRFENDNPRDIEIVGDTATRTIRGLRYRTDYSNAGVAPIFSSGVSGAGKIVIDNLDVFVGFEQKTPTAGLFENPATFELRTGRVAVPSAAFKNTGFVANHITWAIGNDPYKDHHMGSRRFFDNPNFYRTGVSEIAATFETNAAGAGQGPVVDLFRSSAGGAGNLLAHLTWSGKDGAGNYAQYAGLRGIILDPTDTSEDGGLDVLTAIAGTLAARARFQDGLMLPPAVAGGDKGIGTVNAQTAYYLNNVLIADAANIPVIGPASATDNAVSRFDLATGKLVQNSSVLVADDGSVQLPEVAAPAAAAADKLNLFAFDVGARTLPAFRASSGLASPLQPLLARNKVALWNAPGTSTNAPGVFGINPPLALGTATLRSVATTNLFTRLRRLGLVSATAAGSLAGHYMAAAQYTIGDGASLGGFHYVCRFGVSDAAAVAGARMFVGLRNAVAAPTNVEPNTLTDAVGVAQLSTSGNLHIVHGGSVAQTAIDLGANFPANTLSADAYEVSFFAPVNSQVIHYRVERLNTGHVAVGTLSGTVGTAIPAATTLLGHTAWRCNNATALAAGIDLVSVYIESDY